MGGPQGLELEARLYQFFTREGTTGKANHFLLLSHPQDGYLAHGSPEGQMIVLGYGTMSVPNTNKLAYCADSNMCLKSSSPDLVSLHLYQWETCLSYFQAS